MDLRRNAQDSSNRQVRSQQSRSSSSLEVRQTSDRSRQHPQTSPLPQTQWSNVPLPYRPRDLPDPSDRPRRTITGNALSSSATPEPLRTRRRPQALREAPRGMPDVVDRSSQERPARDTTLLYPEMSPYADRMPSDPARGPRAVSQPSSPSYFQTRFQESEPPFMQIPRSPTYPPAGRRRMHSASGVTDAAFQDEEDFRLFAAATAGLGPEQAFRQPNSPIRSRSSPQPVSPEEQTPTTMRALQHLASMPLASTQQSRSRLQASAGGLDLWLQPPSRPRSPDEDSDDELPPDDELPDYAQSQAQAQQHQRAEAARRAQELQRRWHASGGNRGI
ncbi:hypothetical protein LTR56_012593 [Elasticomyces elasticus]|uniref:Uncharacterized protein n=1 Tax=Elasticomyces elasticus TaxID=574655 RepID=A0AAN7ZR07_9PEZI|nr:hypothetical protein LTR22_018468 [Elasticomyces elasticus]KAK3639233.1 hypothetical protein LTR56_012593 [Elasticomyces elasticus]KAK4912537.1 hypothetical protein LTR49_019004 [Elasticomyces elasticus]KAK5708167.1 hypothetical protein LTR97_000707 [Elasticomyces elasticus]KAK5726853.1 hypothetical protein LTR15_002743 [Elasticomyces elasticus]